MATISKKAAAYLTELLKKKDIQQILFEIHREKAYSPEGDDQAFGKMLECKLSILQIDSTLCREFGIELEPVSKLDERTDEYFKMLQSWEKRNQIEVVA